jgi:hypothetical protein
MGGPVYWRGVQLDIRSAEMMTEVEVLCPGIPVTPSQGSWSGAAASAGTHTGCGAIDIKAVDLSPGQRAVVVDAMRRVGWAAWLRTPDQSDWPWHIHGIAVQPGGKGDLGCLSGSAHDQVVDYYENRNGLASGAPDDGPRDHVGATWEAYRPPAQEEAGMRLISAEGRGVALYGPGYWCVVTEEQLAVLQGAGIPSSETNARGFDLVRAAVLQGLDSVDAD